MKIFLSVSTQGFYVEGIHDSIPEDAISISQETYDALQGELNKGNRVLELDADGTPLSRPIEVVKTPSQIKEEKISAVQRHLDTAAKAWGYDDIFTAVSYAEEPAVLQFQNEGKALRSWRSNVWARCFAILSEVEKGLRPIPTDEELITELPEAPAKP